MELKSLYFNLAYVFFLFGAKNWACKKTHIQSGAEKSLFQFCMTVTKPLSPFYLEEMKSLSVPRAVSQVSMRVHKPTVAYKLAQQKKPQGRTLTYYHKNN